TRGWPSPAGRPQVVGRPGGPLKHSGARGTVQNASSRRDFRVGRGVMPPHSIGSGTVSFGLVSIPIRMYTAASSAGGTLHLLHPKCGNRIRQQTYWPVDKEVVDRTALVKGYEVQKDEYVRFTEEELKSLEGETSRVIDIAEFVPLAKVDPIYFEKTYYLGPD